MSKAQDGDTVQVHYTGTLDDGETFDSSVGGEPLEFELGSGALLAAFETAVRGLEPGEKTNVRIEAEDGYGTHREELVIEVDRHRLPDDLEPEIGQPLQLEDPNGQKFVVHVSAIGEEQITLDGNHPLAGQTLNFDIELVAIA